MHSFCSLDSFFFVYDQIKHLGSGNFPLMSPITPNRYVCRYHPFSRPLSLHIVFNRIEQPACLPHSLYTIYPTDSDVSTVNPPQPLASKAVVLKAEEYFIMQERDYPNRTYEKPKGDVGRSDPKRGYSLGAALMWPTEVYREVQVGFFGISSFFIYFQLNLA